VHVHQDRLLLGTLPAAHEGSLDVFIPVISSQEKANSAKDHFGVSDMRVVVPKKAGIRWDSQPALAQHCEAAKCGNGIGVEMN
jgi:hypothetical protein